MNKSLTFYDLGVGDTFKIKENAYDSKFNWRYYKTGRRTYRMLSNIARFAFASETRKIMTFAARRMAVEKIN